MLSCSVMSDSVTAWTVACQPPLSMGFPRQKYWSGLPYPPPGDLPQPGIKPTSPALAGGFFTTEPPGKPVKPLLCAKQYLNLTHRTLFHSAKTPLCSSICLSLIDLKTEAYRDGVTCSKSSE